MSQRLPNVPQNINHPVLTMYLNQLVQALEKRMKELDSAMTKDRIKVSNANPQYTFDVSTGTLADTKNVLGTLLIQLQTSGDLA